MVCRKLYLIVLTALIFSCATTSVTEKVEPVHVKSLYEIYIGEAEKGDSAAQVQVGISFETGNGVAVSYKEAYKWYQTASAGGSSEAYYRIGLFYEKGHVVEQSRENAFEWFLSAASTGYLPAYKKIILYYDSFPEEQMVWIQKGIEAGDPYSNYRYGMILEEQDKNGALLHFIKAADSKEPEILGLLSILSLSHQYEFFDDKKAMEYLLPAAESGDVRSLIFMGWMYEFGHQTEMDMDKAFTFYERASYLGDPLALFNLSRFYEEGIYVDKNMELSESFYNQIPEEYYSPVSDDLLLFSRSHHFEKQQIILNRFKALGNDREALYQLGLLSGPEESAMWFLPAAEAGHSGAMVELARIYLQENSVERNPVKAAAWLMVSENLGNKESDLKSSEVLETLSEEEKMEVSLLFVDLFYNNEEVQEP